MPPPGPDRPIDGGLRGRDLIGLGGLLAAAVIGFTLIGILIDRLADTEPAFTLAGVGLGIVLGATAFWLRVRDALRQP
jgi:F0F1-type ATP synthase assembly protein I